MLFLDGISIIIFVRYMRIYSNLRRIKMKVDIFIKPQENPIKTVEDNIIRIYYNGQWVDFIDGKVFIKFPDDSQKNLE